jgi:hypothetical protein
MGMISVDESQRGQILATEEILIGITLKTVPTRFNSEEYFTLVDGYFIQDAQSNPVLIQEMRLFNLHISTSPFSPDSVLMTNGRMRFANLILKDIPTGCTFEIETGPYPAPPVLTALSPDTAVSGDPDFTLSCQGTGFGINTVIEFSGVDEPTTLVSDTEVTTGVKPSLFAPVTVPVRVHEGPIYSDPIDFTFTAPVVAGAEE